jgi:sporulation-control protein
MMFKKVLSRLGVGSADVNLVLQHHQVRLGETIQGELFIEGGTVEQQINKLDVELRLSVNVNNQTHTQTVATIPVSPSFVIQPGEKKVLPFSYELPMTLPVTRSGVSYTFVTRLDIAGGVDTLDHDSLEVLPPLPLEKIFYAFNKLGFREKATSGKLTKHGQEFAFFPTEQLKEAVQEVEVLAFIEENGVRLNLEVDMYAEVLGLKEKELKKEVFFRRDEIVNPEILAAKLLSTLKEMIDHHHAYTGSAYHYHTSAHHHGQGLMGAVGGFAAGMVAGMMTEELIEDVIEEAFDLEEDTESFFDIFDGDDDIL